MANLNTTQIAQNLLGPARRVYHQDLTVHANQPHLKIDTLGAGDFIFVDSVPAGLHPVHSFEQKGLLTSVERSSTASTNSGHWAAISGHNIVIPERFMLTATFIEPQKVSLTPNQPPPVGTYAPSLLLSFGNVLTGATSQFRATGQRLNTPAVATPPNRPDIPANLSNQVTAAQNPSAFTLVLHVERGATNSIGNAKLFVGDTEADSVSNYSFGNGLTAATIFDTIRVGMGTASGGNYRASVFVTEFEIWVPNPNH